MLVDGFACLYQAHYGQKWRDSRNSRDEPTWAVYGFMRQLLRLVDELQPSHVAVMMDNRAAPLRRRSWFEDYKKDREPPPDDLVVQFAKARDACEAFEIPLRSREGYEADDLIHTYAREAGEDFDVHIVSMDKDLAQLIRPNIWLHDTRSPAGRVDAEAVVARWGVAPEQMADLLALWGDECDGVPGVPGIGRKKGAALLRRHGTLDAVLAAARRGDVGVRGVGPKVTRSLVEHAETALRMREVMRLEVVAGLDAGAFRREFRAPLRDARWQRRALAFCEREGLQRLLEPPEAGSEEDPARDI